MIYETVLAGHRLRYSFQEPKTHRYFGSWLRPSASEEWDIRQTPEKIQKMQDQIVESASASYAEYKSLIYNTAEELLQYDCCIFHAVSFIWHGKAFLLTAPSGTGKSTQFFNWQRLFPGEIKMISGDLPVLENKADGRVLVHGSPWNGKERVGNRLVAPLAGIVLLEQGPTNQVSPLPVRDAVYPFILQFFVRPKTVEQIRSLTRLMDRMLRCAPCFKLVNRGDDASTLLLRDTLRSLAEGESHDRL